MRGYLSVIVLLQASIALANNPNQGSLSLEQFMQQVETGNEKVISARKATESMQLRSKESRLMLSPSFSANLYQLTDEEQKQNIASQGIKTEQNFWSLGLMQNTDFGLKAKLAYSSANTEIDGASSGFLTYTDYYLNRTSIELSYSLWRNLFGREVSASVNAGQSQVEAGAYAEAYQLQMLLAESEIRYWSLALAKEAVRVNEENLALVKKTRDWNAKRAQMKLADESDLLQSEAMYKLRELELLNSKEQLRIASLEFNAARGIDSDVVESELVSLQTLDLSKLKVSSKPGMRSDILQAKASMDAARASANLGNEKNKPELELYMTYNMNGLSDENSTSQEQAFKSDYATQTVGVKFSTPLNFSQLNDNRSAYQAEAQIAEMRYRRKLFDYAKEWKDINAKFADIQKRWQLAKEIENVQKAKYNREKVRHQNARTTIYFVLQYEQDYANAQLNRLKIEVDLLNTYAQLKTFGGLQ